MPSESSALESVRAHFDRLLKRPGMPLPLDKGYPDMNVSRQRIAERLRKSLDGGDHDHAIARAHELAAIDMYDGDAFCFFLELVSMLNAAALSQARATLMPKVIAHVSCAPRIDRATASCSSFAGLEADGVSQIVIVGGAASHRFAFDPSRRTLSVPTSDAYEHLPSKVVAAMFFLSLCGGIKGVLKVDDDHRLRSKSELMRGFKRLESRRPLQIGSLVRVGVLGLHRRAWHFGKTSDPVLNVTPYTLPGTTRWANGANGYFLNDHALRVMLWSYVYFPQYIGIGLYEDMVVSDLIERQGGRIASMEMERAVTTVDQY